MSTKTSYTIEDGTGSIDVIIWADTSDNDSEAQKRSQWRYIDINKEYKDILKVLENLKLN